MKGKAIIPLVLGLCVGVVAVKFLVDTLQRAKGANADREVITVVRARQDIDSFQKLTPELLEVVETVENNLIPSADRIFSLDEVLDRVTSKGIPQYTPLLKSMLAEVGTPPGLKGRIPAGYRAVSVKIDEVTGVAYQVRPGDWVDVIVVMDVESAGMTRRKETIAEVILQHVEVLAIGQVVRKARSRKSSSAQPAKSATLLVTEEEAPKLHLAATRGKITLSMRGADDQITTVPRIARGSEVISGLRDPNAAPPVGTGSQSGSPSFLQQLMAKMAMAQAPRRPPSFKPEPPHGITVYRGLTPPNGVTLPGSTVAADWTQIRKITFASPRSRKIVSVTEGPVSPSQTVMNQKGRGSVFRVGSASSGH